MSNIFFGDSLTEGTNSNKSFTHEFFDSYNKGISGTTIGEYSIYPVDGNSLLSVYNKDIPTLKKCGHIFIEYGANDVSSIMCGFTTLDKVIISFVKAIDGIKQINNYGKIHFLTISDDIDIVKEHAEYQCMYLRDDYFRGYDFNFPASKWAELYMKIMVAVSKRVEVIPMVDDKDFFYKYLSTDNLHPNEEGHSVIAHTIKKYL